MTKTAPQQHRINRAMILAAGLGTRFKPWTDRHPKALALVNGKSLLQRNIEYLQRYGIREVVVNVHHFADQILEELSRQQGWGSRILISDEKEEVLETGGGLKKARPYLEKEPFLLLNVDILTDLDLFALMLDHFRHRPLATLAVTGRQTSRYFLFDEGMELRGWRNVGTAEERHRTEQQGELRGELRAASCELRADEATRGRNMEDRKRGEWMQKAFSGIHLIGPEIFPLLEQEGKFSMVDVYLSLSLEHRVRGFDHSHSRLIDVGKPESVEQAEKLFP